MILDGSHRKWCVATSALLLLATASYVVYVAHSPGGPRGSSVVGMVYGVAGSALMIFAGLISLRKKVPTWPIGSAQAWLRGHIWLGLLSVPLVLFHAGFRWGGPLEQALFIVTATVIISGLIDLGAQQFLPRQMTARVPLETFYAQIPFECRLLQLEGDVAVAGACGPLPLQADESVATSGRMKLLGVGGRQPLPLVYRMPESKNVQSAEAPKPSAKKTAAKTDSLAVSGEPTAGESKPLAAAEKPSAGKLSAAEKIAMMRAAKKPAGAPADAVDKNPPTTSATQSTETPPPAAEKEQPAAAKSPMSAAEKIALMRSLKHTSKPAASESPAESASEPAASAPPAEVGAKKPLTAAGKIALMRAKGKPAAGASPAAAASAAPKPAAAVEKKPLAKRPAEKPAAEKPLDPVEKKRAAEGLERFYLESVRPFLAHESRARGALGSEVNAGGVFAVVESGLTEELRPVLHRLLDLCEKRRQLSVQERIHWALHFWLFIHVPLSLALLGLGVAHAIMSVYY